MKAYIRATSYFLPKNTLDNASIAKEFPEWSVDKVSTKTGISNRHIAADNEFSSDLAYNAALKLFDEHRISPEHIQFLILCTQSPDFFLPTTACILQDKLNIPITAGALDVNLGCSGFVYAVGLAKGLIESDQVSNVLILTADTYSKFLNSGDKSVKTIFGDGAAASFVDSGSQVTAIHKPFYGTDGAGAQNLIVPYGGLRVGTDFSPNSESQSRGLSKERYDLYMDGPEIFNFTIRIVPNAIKQTLSNAGLDFHDIDLFVFHQANKFILTHLRDLLQISPEKFYVSLSESGNTVSSSIPIALSNAEKEGVLHPGMRVLTLGFGVGLSWAGTVLVWNAPN